MGSPVPATTKRLITSKGNSSGDGYYYSDDDSLSYINTIVVLRQIDGIMLNCLEYLDVVTLIKKKQVNKQWQNLCTTVIDNKCGDDKKKFKTQHELKQAVNKYSPGSHGGNTMQCLPLDTEDIASTYGYPINKWDVSSIKDFSEIFYNKYYFNEPIESWDVSKATTMKGMFGGARSFNQDISSWDVSNVTNMTYMFNAATSFNQDISSWDVSNVTDMSYMFWDAWSFNQDISTWDVSNATPTTEHMFYKCPIDDRHRPSF